MPVFDGRAVAAVFLLATAAPVAAIGLPDCGEADQQRPRVYQSESDAYRLFERPVVNYPAGTDLGDVDEHLSLLIGVDASGRPMCIGAMDSEFPMPRVKQKLSAAALHWRYRPFERDGKPVSVQFYQPIDVQILPERKAVVPPVRAEDTSVTLVRVGCFWQCAEYAITVRGDGWVGYRGLRYVAIKDDRAWKLPAAEVAPLLALASDPGLWAAETDYHAKVHDAETIMVRVDAGRQRKQTVLYPASHPGAPIAMRRLAEAIVRRTGVNRWVYLSDDTIDSLQEETFDFTSPAGRDLLVRSFHHRRRIDEAAILRLLELGTSAETGESPEPWTVLDIALEERRSALIEPLIAGGVLLTGGQPDQGKIDSAFRAAIRGGRLEPAQRIWRMVGTRPHPALDFANGSQEEYPDRRFPVALLLDPDHHDDAWEGFAIARWLESLGNDLSVLSARGTGLMSIAAEADDPEFMRHLIARGIDPSSLGDGEFMRFSVRHGEDMALSLLEARLAHRPRGWELPSNFLAVVELQEWQRVIAWLDAHPEVKHRKPRQPCPRVTQVAKPTETEKSAVLACAAGSGS